MFAAAAVFAAGFALPAAAQTGKNFNVKTRNFDLWCQETQHWSSDRCDRRTPEDQKTFEDFRAQIERYEVPYLQQREKDLALSRDILHNDPVDNPIHRDPQAQQQLPTAQPRSPSP